MQIIWTTADMTIRKQHATLNMNIKLRIRIRGGQVFSLALDQTFQYISVWKKRRKAELNLILWWTIHSVCLAQFLFGIYNYFVMFIIVWPNVALVSTNFVKYFFIYNSFIHAIEKKMCDECSICWRNNNVLANTFRNRRRSYSFCTGIRMGQWVAFIIFLTERKLKTGN